jgi:predicted alpha/beta superfamily hydrolase
MLIIKSIYLPLLGKERTLRIYLPSDYYHSQQAYPVLYMHDGQNLFDQATAAYGMSWDMGSIMDQFALSHQPYLIVGIDNGELDRLLEYSHWENKAMEQQFDAAWIGRCGGQGALYLQDIVSTIKPMIDAEYRTLSDYHHTMIAGSSMGGLISLMALLEYPLIFGQALCLSNAFWFAIEPLLQTIINYKGPTDRTIYLDVGSEESTDPLRNHHYLHCNQLVYKELKKHFKDHVQLQLILAAKHNELAWNARMLNILQQVNHLDNR